MATITLGRPRVSYARDKYRYQRRRFLRANARRLTVVSLMVAVAAIPFAVVGDYLGGLGHGLLLAGYVFMVISAFHAITGAQRTIAGAWGEDNTRDELKVARRKRLIRSWVDNVETQAGDVDHLVITRAGLVLALDSKWHAETDFDSCRRDTEAARRAARTARLVLRSLGRDVPVRPVVVMWGGAQSDLPAEHQMVDGVDVVQGRNLVQWLRQFSAPTCDPVEASALQQELIDFKRRVQPTRRLD